MRCVLRSAVAVWVLAAASALRSAHNTRMPLHARKPLGYRECVKRTLLVRGGSTAVHMKDCLSEALNLIGQIKTPAALLAGACLSTMFIPLKEDTPNERRLSRLYTTLITITFASTLSSVFCSTVLSTQLLSGGFSHFAQSSVQLLEREFYCEFLAVRATFLSGLLTFMLALLAKGWSVFGTKPAERTKATIVTLILAPATVFMVSFYDHHLVDNESFAKLILTFSRHMFANLWRQFVFRSFMALSLVVLYSLYSTKKLCAITGEDHMQCFVRSWKEAFGLGNSVPKVKHTSTKI